MLLLKILNPITREVLEFKYRGAKSQDQLLNEISLVIEGKSTGLGWQLDDGVILFPTKVLANSIIWLQEVSEDARAT